MVLDERAPDHLGEAGSGDDALYRPLGLVVERVLPGVRDRADGAQRGGPGAAEHPGQAAVVLVVDRRVVGLRHVVLAATVDGASRTDLMQMG